MERNIVERLRKFRRVGGVVLGKGVGKCILLSIYVVYLIWFGFDNEFCKVGFVFYLKDERFKIRSKVGGVVVFFIGGVVCGKDRMTRGVL